MQPDGAVSMCSQHSNSVSLQCPRLCALVRRLRPRRRTRLHAARLQLEHRVVEALLEVHKDEGLGGAQGVHAAAQRVDLRRGSGKIKVEVYGRRFMRMQRRSVSNCGADQSRKMSRKKIACTQRRSASACSADQGGRILRDATRRSAHTWRRNTNRSLRGRA